MTAKADNSAVELVRNCTSDDWGAYIRNFPVYRGMDIATRKLASVCDYAEKLDGAGYNSSDTGTGHWLSHVGVARLNSEKSLSWAKRLLKYRMQLAGMGIDYPACLFDGITAGMEAETEAINRMV